MRHLMIVAGLMLATALPSSQHARADDAVLTPQEMGLAPLARAQTGRSSAVRGGTGKATPRDKRADARPINEPVGEPNVLPWADQEIMAALRHCVRVLAPLSATLKPADPIRNGRCGAPAPVALENVGSDVPVAMSPKLTVNCPMVAALHTWLDQVVQPAAREVLGESVVRLTGVTAYQCRDRVGGELGQLSEHAFANAVDITSLVTSSGRRVDVLTSWGTRVDPPSVAKAQPTSGRPATSSATPAVDTKEPARASTKMKRASARATAKRRADSTASISTTTGIVSNSNSVPGAGVDAQHLAFLKRIHKGACGIFSTVLGPEANAAHRDHFHLDLTAGKRNRGAHCE